MRNLTGGPKLPSKTLTWGSINASLITYLVFLAYGFHRALMRLENGDLTRALYFKSTLFFSQLRLLLYATRTNLVSPHFQDGNFEFLSRHFSVLRAAITSCFLVEVCLQEQRRILNLFEYLNKIIVYKKGN